MTRNSKVILEAATILVIVNAMFSVRSEHWVIPVIIAVTASPVLRPNQFNLLLAVCATLAMIVSQSMHNEVGARIGFIFAVVSIA